MTTKTLSIFYGADNLPYKDEAREIHFPLVGNTFNGSNNVTNIRFYVDRIGGAESVTWLVVSKLPNGQIGNEVLNSNNAVYDEELGEHYIELSLSSYYTSLKGDVYLSLNGYQGGVEVEQDEDTGVYSIYGTPTIQATGVVKIGINYAPQLLAGSHFNTSDLQQVLGAISDKANISDVILVVDNIATIDLSGYNDGQLFYDKATKLIYKNDNGEIKYFDGPAIVNLGSYTFPQVVGNYITIPITNEQHTILSSSPNIIVRIDDVQDNYYFRKQLIMDTQAWTSILGDIYTLLEYGSYNNYFLRLYYRGSITSKQYVDSNFVGLTGNQTIAGQKTFSGKAIFSDANLYNGYLTTNSKNYFARVGVTTGQYVTYKLPSNYSDVGAISLTLATENYVDDQIELAIASLGDVFNYRGSFTVSYINTNLTSDVLVKGDVVNCEDSGTLTLGNVSVLAGDNVVWDGTKWDKLASTIDLSGYVQKTQTIAGIALSGNISADALTSALGFAFTDVTIDEE